MVETYSDPAMVKSNYVRNEKDRYWSAPWTTEALLRRLDTNFEGKVWEPACGRGDMVKVLVDHGLDVVASDVDLSEFDTNTCLSSEWDFLKRGLPFGPIDLDISAIITNPPYNKAEEFVTRAMALAPVVAMLLRSEWNQAKGRADLFNQPPFAFEIVLTSRPLWDWWYRDKPEASPRHGYSWYVWDRRWRGLSSQFWEGKKAK